MSEKEKNELGALVKAQGTALQKIPGGLIRRGMEELASLVQFRSAPDLIKEMCHNSDMWVRHDAFEALRKMGPSYTGWLVGLEKVIHDEPTYWLSIHWAALLLANFTCSPESVFPVFIGYIDGMFRDKPEYYDDYREEFISACGMLAKYRHTIDLHAATEVVKALIRILNCRLELPRFADCYRALIQLLGNWGKISTPALPYLSTILDWNDSVHVQAIQNIVPGPISETKAWLTSLRTENTKLDSIKGKA
jgi:hypothetical protein